MSSLVQQRLYHCKFLTNQTNTLAKTARALAHMYKQLLKLLQLLSSSQGNGHSLALNRDRHHSNATVIMSIQLLYNGLWIYIYRYAHVKRANANVSTKHPTGSSHHLCTGMKLTLMECDTAKDLNQY